MLRCLVLGELGCDLWSHDVVLGSEAALGEPSVAASVDLDDLVVSADCSGCHSFVLMVLEDLDDEEGSKGWVSC